jgi:hypothetical protein
MLKLLKSSSDETLFYALNMLKQHASDTTDTANASEALAAPIIAVVVAVTQTHH